MSEQLIMKIQQQIKERNENVYADSKTVALILRAGRLCEQERYDKTLEVLQKADNAIDDEFNKSNSDFFSYIANRALLYEHKASCYALLNNVETRYEALNNAKLAFISECWLLAWVLHKRNADYCKILADVGKELPSYKTLYIAMDDLRGEVNNDNHECILSPENIDLIFKGLLHDIIVFYAKNATDEEIASADTTLAKRAFKRLLRKDRELQDEPFVQTILKAVSAPDCRLYGDALFDALGSFLAYDIPPESLDIVLEDFPQHKESDECFKYIEGCLSPHLTQESRYRYKYQACIAENERLVRENGILQEKNISLYQHSSEMEELYRTAEKRYNAEHSNADKLHADVTRLTQQVENLKKENEMLSSNSATYKKGQASQGRSDNKKLVKTAQALEKCRDELAEATKQRDDFRQKYLEIMSEKTALQAELNSAKEELRRIEREKRAAEKYPEVIEPDAEAEAEDKEPIKDCFAESNLRFAVVGGPDSWRSAMLARHPKFKDIGNNKGFDTGKLDAIDVLVINTKNTSHACTEKAKANASKDAIVIMNSFNNVDIVDQTIKERIGMS